MSWPEHFPFPHWRELQAKGLDFIVEHFDKADDILLEEPPGIGKSAQAMALARERARLGQSTYIATTTRELEDQYMDDFRKLGLRQLHAKRHYPCNEWRTCDLGSATIRTINGARKRCQLEACSYQVAKAAFMASPLSIANAAFLLTNARHVKGWEPRPLAIFDEAHTLAETVAGNYSIPILARDVTQMPTEGDELEWLRDRYVHKLAEQICALKEEFQPAVADDPCDPALDRLFKRLEDAQRKLQNLLKLLADDPDEWVFDLQPDLAGVEKETSASDQERSEPNGHRSSADKLREEGTDRQEDFDPLANTPADPFDVDAWLGAEHRFHDPYLLQPPTERQLETLTRLGIHPAYLKNRGAVNGAFDILKVRWKRNMATIKQARYLKRLGHQTPWQATFQEAHEFISHR